MSACNFYIHSGRFHTALSASLLRRGRCFLLASYQIAKSDSIKLGVIYIIIEIQTPSGG